MVRDYGPYGTSGGKELSRGVSVVEATDMMGWESRGMTLCSGGLIDTDYQQSLTSVSKFGKEHLKRFLCHNLVPKLKEIVRRVDSTPLKNMPGDPAGHIVIVLSGRVDGRPIASVSNETSKAKTTYATDPNLRKVPLKGTSGGLGELDRRVFVDDGSRMFPTLGSGLSQHGTLRPLSKNNGEEGDGTPDRNGKRRTQQ